MSNSDIDSIFEKIINVDQNDIVKVLTEYINKGFIDKKDSSGNTLLLYALLNNKLPIVYWLIKKGANVNRHNYNADTPLLIALRILNENKNLNENTNTILTGLIKLILLNVNAIDESEHNYVIGDSFNVSTDTRKQIQDFINNKYMKQKKIQEQELE